MVGGPSTWPGMRGWPRPRSFSLPFIAAFGGLIEWSTKKEHNLWKKEHGLRSLIMACACDSCN